MALQPTVDLEMLLECRDSECDGAENYQSEAAP